MEHIIILPNVHPEYISLHKIQQMLKCCFYCLLFSYKSQPVLCWWAVNTWRTNSVLYLLLGIFTKRVLLLVMVVAMVFCRSHSPIRIKLKCYILNCFKYQIDLWSPVCHETILIVLIRRQSPDIRYFSPSSTTNRFWPFTASLFSSTGTKLAWVENTWLNFWLLPSLPSFSGW